MGVVFAGASHDWWSAFVGLPDSEGLGMEQQSAALGVGVDVVADPRANQDLQARSSLASRTAASPLVSPSSTVPPGERDGCLLLLRWRVGRYLGGCWDISFPTARENAW